MTNLEKAELRLQKQKIAAIKAFRAANQKLFDMNLRCFLAALQAVLVYGGVLEHPEASHAWPEFGLPRPLGTGGGWLWFNRNRSHFPIWTCQVEQGHYGHPARKKTWLLYAGKNRPPELIWGPSTGRRLDEGFHSAAERKAARAAGKKPIKRLSAKENLTTPVAFRDVLISLARLSRA